MKASPRCLALIKRHEGRALKAYKCPGGRWTIGYGHTGWDVKEGDEITSERADELLISDVAYFEVRLRRAVLVTLSQNQFDALLSFMFNIGASTFSKSTKLMRLNDFDYRGAAREFDRWVFAKDRKLPGLVARRMAERELFQEGMAE